MMALTPDQEKLKEAAQFASPGPWKGDRHDGTVKYELLDANDNTVIMGDNNNNPDGPFGINRYEDEVYLKLAHPAAILTILAQLEQVQGWVSVRDRLPEEGGLVLIAYWPFNNRKNERVTESAYHHDGAFFDSDGDEMHPPSHWMLLPPPPEAA